MICTEQWQDSLGSPDRTGQPWQEPRTAHDSQKMTAWYFHGTLAYVIYIYVIYFYGFYFYGTYFYKGKKI